MSCRHAGRLPENIVSNKDYSKAKPYVQTDEEVLSRLNKFLKDSVQISHCHGLRLDFSKGCSKLFTAVVFSEHDLIGMTEAFNFECT